MGDAIVQCDGCGLLARRRPGQPCPDHWFYLESEDRTPGIVPSTYIVWACSAACRDKLWKHGPASGHIDEDGSGRMRARRARRGRPGRGGLGGKRIAELEAAMRTLLDEHPNDDQVAAIRQLLGGAHG